MKGRGRKAALVAALVVGWFIVRPTVYGPFTGSEALNAGLVATVPGLGCVGLEVYGDPGIFTGCG